MTDIKIVAKTEKLIIFMLWLISNKYYTVFSK